MSELDIFKTSICSCEEMCVFNREYWTLRMAHAIGKHMDNERTLKVSVPRVHEILFVTYHDQSYCRQLVLALALQSMNL